MSGFTKLFSTIIASSIWSESHHVVRVWITMLAIKDMHGKVEGSVPGLARLANVTREECDDALARFLAPDHDSRDMDLHPEREGRRIEKVPGGWVVLNHEHYRDLAGGRDASMTPEAIRKRRQRAQDGQSVTERDMTGTLSVSVSASSGESVGGGSAEGGSGLVAHDALMAHFAGISVTYYGIVSGFIRACRNPQAVGAILSAHLTGEMDYPKSDPEVVARAIATYAANQGADRFNAAYFAGFVRRARGQRAQGIEANEIKAHDERKLAMAAAESTADARRRAAVERFEQEHPERYAELATRAEATVDPKYKRGRGVMVRGALIELIQAEVANASAQ